MARIDTLTNYLSDVAEAIKTKKGDDTPILASEFDTEITNLPSGGSSRAWSAIGYNGEPKSLLEMLVHSKEIYDNWDNTIIDLKSKVSGDKKLVWFPLVDTSNVTNMNYMFYKCASLKEVPQLNTSNVTNMSYMFFNCTSLTEIPQFDTSNVINMSEMFSSCNNLTDTSIDNILQFCITSKIENGTLKYLGFNSNVYPINRIEALPHYQDFLDAGWTIGY